jgi:hypothetical protein
MSEPVLCYIRGCWAFFTTNLKKQHGYNWNETPYNATTGNPYDCFNGCRITTVAWEADLIPVCERSNRYYSVCQINKRKTPWLTSPDWEDNENPDMEVWAGTTLSEFKSLIYKVGGTVYEVIQPQEESSDVK